MLWPKITGKKYEIGEEETERGRIKAGTTNLKAIKELESELRGGNAFPKRQRGHRRKGNEEDKTRGISNLG